MEQLFFPKDVVIVGNSVGVVVGKHYSINDLYVVEFHDSLEYVRESALIATSPRCV
jgi:hypothetical protein